MKKVAFFIAMTLVFTSCSWLNDDTVEETQTNIVEVENEVESSDSNTDTKQEDTSTEETVTEPISEENTSEEPTIVETTLDEAVFVKDIPETNTSNETSITEELANGTEDEQLLNEVFNEINEVFELVEQNGGQ